jgi:hypothetical protein
MQTRRWSIIIDLSEEDALTRATAVLQTQAAKTITGHGSARCNPKDMNVPEIGDELAAARALSDLAHKLLDSAADDIEGVTHRPVHLTS